MIANQRTLTHERAGRMLAGVSALACVALAWLASPWFLLGAAGTAVSLIFSAVTDRCVVKSLLIRLGLPGERDLGRAEAVAEATAAAAAARAEAPSSPAAIRSARTGRLAGRLGVTVN